MPRLLIWNDATEQMLGMNLPFEERFTSANSAWRHIWSARRGDVVVVPASIPDCVKTYIFDTLGMDQSAVEIIHPKSLDGAPVILSDRAILEPSFVELLRSKINMPSSWSLEAYYESQGVAILRRNLGLARPLHQHFLEQRGSDLLNRKAIFRRLASGAGIAIPKGQTVINAIELKKAVSETLNDCDTAIIKRDSAAGGDGNIAVTNLPKHSISGVRKVVSAKHISSSEDEVSGFYTDLWQEFVSDDEGVLLVEEYKYGCVSVYAEFFIDRFSGEVHFLNDGTLRMSSSELQDENSLQWTGFELPADLPKLSSARFHSEATRAADLCRTLGYHGRVNVDAIISQSGEVFINEINGRRGGCSHIYDLAVELLGSDYANHYSMRTRNDLYVDDFLEAVQFLHDNNLTYDNNRKTGVIFLVYDDLVGKVQYLCVGKNADQARRLEGALKPLSRCAKPYPITAETAGSTCHNEIEIR